MQGRFLLTSDIALAGGDRKDAQYRYILSMILKLRMFNSHPLTAQDFIQRILASQFNLDKLNSCLDDDMAEDHPTRVTVRLFNMLIEECENCEVANTARVAEEPNAQKLVAQFRAFMAELRISENGDLQLLRMCCPVCKAIPMETHVSSCMHLFCEDCLMSLAGSTKDTESRTVCPVCDVPIEESRTVWTC